MRAHTSAVVRNTPARRQVVVVHRDRSTRDAFRALLESSGLISVRTAPPSHLTSLLHPPRPHLLLVVLDGDAATDAATVHEVGQLQPPASAVLVANARTSASCLAAARAVPGCLVVGDQPGLELADLVSRACHDADAGGDADDIGARVESRNRFTGRATFDSLAPLDRQIVVLIKRGRTIPEIARALAIAEADARDRLLGILDLLGIADRVQLAAYPLNTRARPQAIF
jgi:DNA-binding NarL/FixJ family response regulator